MPSHAPILPGATLGVLGGGQLGRMFVQAAHKLGYRVHVLAPEADTPTGQIADHSVVADYADVDAVAAFSRSVEVITFEFENVPSETAQAAARHAPVRPAGSVLHTSQHRLREKSALRDAGLPVTPFVPVRSRADLHSAIASLGTPAVLKTAAWGYDGKGQMRIAGADDIERAWEAMACDELILEKAIMFDCELSVIAARGIDGELKCYEPVENEHRRHILDISVCPARVPEQVRREAVEIARQVMQTLDVVGVLCVEFFLAQDRTLMINEVAPRRHHSGHLTLDACVTSQFEQQVRAICGLPLGSTHLHRPAAMANLMGELWSTGAPLWHHALASADVKLHLYGKTDARPGRKMGHLTALANDVASAADLVRRARQALVAGAAAPLNSPGNTPSLTR